MKKRLILMTMLLTLSISFCACSDKKSDLTDDSETVTTEAVAEEAEDTSEKPDGTQYTSLQDFAKGFASVNGESFTVSAGYSEDAGIQSSVESKSGMIGSFLTNNDSTLITIDYENDKNALVVTSYVLNQDGVVEEKGSVTFEDAIFMSDNARVCVGNLSFLDINNAIMVEARGEAYTYADGIYYHIGLVEVAEDGSLHEQMNSGLAGSGDEDITAKIRDEFNLATGSGISQQEMEDAFYYGNLLLTQNDATILAGYSYQSEAAKYADSSAWDKASEIGSHLYELSAGETVAWATGKFD